MPVNFTQLLMNMEKMNASDIHLKVGAPPVYRVYGELIPVDHPPLTKEEVAAIVDKVVPEQLKARLTKEGAVDFAFSTDQKTRFRSNAFYQRGTLSLALRRLQSENLDFDALKLPPIIKEIANARRGMVLLTGPTGTGKSTTMAAMIDHINTTRREHIITIEDPIEFIHRDKLSLIEQREIGLDARTFDEALRHTLREDPNVILIGEMRDRETINIAIRAAMTGHLVISTLHTVNAVQTVDRILKYFSVEEQAGLRSELPIALKSVVSQRLVTAANGPGRVPCVEIMVVNEMIRKLIRENRVEDMIQVIKNNMDGMQTFDQSLMDLYRRKLITLDTGVANAEDVLAFKRMSTGGFAGDDRSRIISTL
jgi:twitching motility protein PilT